MKIYISCALRVGVKRIKENEEFYFKKNQVKHNKMIIIITITNTINIIIILKRQINETRNTFF